MKTFIQALVFTLTVIAMVYGTAWVLKQVPALQEPTDSLGQPLSDMNIIRIAAERNGIEYGSDDWCILLGINKAEGNPKGCEFGIMNPEANTLDKQAGWCAASIVKSRVRWEKAGKPEDFITFMGRRYCPPDAHPLNENWVGNVTYWANRLEAK